MNRKEFFDFIQIKKISLVLGIISIILISGCTFEDYCTPNPRNRNPNYCENEKGEPFICDVIYGFAGGNPWLSECYTNLAIVTQNVTLCDKGYTKICYDGIKNFLDNISICENVEYKLSCYEHFAFKKSDTNICKQYLEGKDKDSCISSMAITTENLSLCDEIGINSLRRDCYMQIARNTQNLLVCDKFINISSKDECYWTVAVEIDDLSLCDLVSDPIWKDSCYSSIAFSTNDPSICNNIINTTKRDHCYFIVARETQNISTCSLITSQSDNFFWSKGMCYKDGAITLEDCDEIKDESEKEICKSNIR